VVAAPKKKKGKAKGPPKVTGAAKMAKLVADALLSQTKNKAKGPPPVQISESQKLTKWKEEKKNFKQKQVLDDI